MRGVQDDWTPTAENINALPAPLRSFIHDLSSNCDPSGTMNENTLLRDLLHQANTMINRLKGMNR